jgi:histidine transport system permease protein/arginine/ornithine transport system permease protein
MEWFDLKVISESLPEFWSGLWLTLQLTVVTLAIGFAFAVPLSIARVSKNPWVNLPVRAYTYFFRGTPMLVQLLLVYYGIGQSEWMQQMWETGNPFWLLFRDASFCALLAFSLNTCAYQLEMFAGAIRNTPHGEVEAAKAMGMTRATALRRIILPSALRRSIPPFSNEAILMLQGSAIASAVTLVDLTGAARNVYSRYYAPFEAFIFVGLLYLAVTFVMVGFFRVAENRWLAHLQPRRSSSAKKN